MRRILFTTLLCVLVGALLSWLSAMVCLILLPAEPGSRPTGGTPGTPSEQMTLWTLSTSNFGCGHVTHHWTREIGEEIPPSRWPAVLGALVRPGPSHDGGAGRGYYYQMHLQGWGWPLISFAGAQVTAMQFDYPPVKNDKLPPPTHSVWTSPPLPRLLDAMRSSSAASSPAPFFPDGVVWPGFAANTAFYAIVLAALWPIPALIRRSRRRRQGQCLSCGYDLRGCGEKTGSCCPECGRPT